MGLGFGASWAWGSGFGAWGFGTGFRALVSSQSSGLRVLG